MAVTTFANWLWAAGFLGNLGLLFVLMARSRWRRFPMFTSLIAYQALNTVVLFFVFRFAGKQAYFWTYWLSTIGNYSLQVALVLELARVVLGPLKTWMSKASSPFLGWSVAGTLIAAAFSLSLSRPQIPPRELWDMRVSLFTSLLICGLFLALSACANRLGIQRGNHVFAVGQGLAAWACTAVLADIVHVATGWRNDLIVLDWLPMLVYVAVLLYWIATLWIAEEVEQALPAATGPYISTTQPRVSQR